MRRPLNTSAQPAVVGRQQRYYELPAAGAGVLCWAVIAGSDGLAVGLEYVWILAIALVLAAWVLRMRLLVTDAVMEFAIVGPWRRRVDLQTLRSLTWKHTGGPASKGVIVVRDDHGKRIQIPVGRLSGGEVWGQMLLEAAERSGATIDDHSKRLLEAETTPAGD